MIEIRDLQKHFGSHAAVSGVSFIARDGEITGILGANGAGKTTVLRMVAGVLRPSGGDAQIDGRSVRTDSLAAQIQLGSLLDHTGIYSRLTPRENLMYFARLARFLRSLSSEEWTIRSNSSASSASPTHPPRASRWENA